MRKRLLVIPLVISVFLSGASWAKTAPAIGLTILYTNDVHGMMEPFDYTALGSVEKNVGGAARRATLIRQIKRQSPKPVIVMDAGDVFTRGPLESFEGKPDFDVMNAMPYDVMTLGNNEFAGDVYTGKTSPRGYEILKERIKQAKFTVLCANVYDKLTGKPVAEAYRIIKRGNLKIGIFGLTAPRVAEYPQAVGLEVKDPIEVAKKIVAELEPKCNFVIALTHIGYGNEGYGLDLRLAREIPSIDAIIGGDSHTWVLKPALVKADKSKEPKWWIGGPLVCQDGEWGKCLGRLDLSLRKAPSGQYLVNKYQGRLIEIDSHIKPAADVEKIIKEAEIKLP